MAENCQYCGGRLKKLHPAHETFCTQRVKVDPHERKLRLIEALVLETMPEEAVAYPEDATKSVAHPRLTQAQKRARQRAAKGGPSG